MLPTSIVLSVVIFYADGRIVLFRAEGRADVLHPSVVEILGVVECAPPPYNGQNQPLYISPFFCFILYTYCGIVDLRLDCTGEAGKTFRPLQKGGVVADIAVKPPHTGTNCPLNNSPFFDSFIVVYLWFPGRERRA